MKPATERTTSLKIHETITIARIGSCPNLFLNNPQLTNFRFTNAITISSLTNLPSQEMSIPANTILDTAAVATIG
jgi:hypothetical protein